MRVLWLLLLSALSLHGATYYVDFTGGSDAANGTTTGTPFKHCPGDGNATGTAGSTTLSAGDRVNFKGGVEYNVAGADIDLTWSGTVGNSIIYDGTNWNGPTRAIITGTNDIVTATAFTDGGVARSNLAFRGLVITNIGGYSDATFAALPTNGIVSPNGGFGILFSTAGSQDIEISGCGFGKIGQWRNTKPFEDENSTVGLMIHLRDSKRVTIKDCDFTASRTCISIKGNISDIVVSNCVLHNYFTWGIDVAPQATGNILSNIYIQRCTIKDYNEHSSAYWTGYGDTPHNDGIFLRTSAIVSTWTNIVIEQSTFSDDLPVGTGTASIYVSQGSSATIRNCLFLNEAHAVVVKIAYRHLNITPYQYVKFHNNTLISPTANLEIDPGNSDPNVVEIYNNAFYRVSTTRNFQIFSADWTNAATTLLWDHNRYNSDYSPVANHYVVFANSGGYQMLPWWVSRGYDTNSTQGALTLTATSGAASTWNARPLLSSALVGAGTNLTSYGGFSTDFYGNPRPSSGAWTIGAIEYVAPLPTAITIGSGMTLGNGITLR